MRFIDEAHIKVKAGDGGPGMVAWRREKFVPLGGPAGGDGGCGGDVILMAKANINSLLEIKRKAKIIAKNGSKGESKNKTGCRGENTIVYVPIGTEIIDLNRPEQTYSLLSHEQSLVICKGGLGGFGNSHFKNEHYQSPNNASLGLKGEAKDLLLTLKVMADVGLLGMPNAGKSSLLAKLSAAKPKIADYPFTTTKPMVGIVEADIGQTFIMADIPGLILGASLGKGLGTRFLRHLERVKLLCHVIDAHDDDLLAKYLTINHELLSYSEYLYNLPQIVVINKIDIINDHKYINEFITYLDQHHINYHQVSAITGQGLALLIKDLYGKLYPQNKVSIFNPLSRLY